MRTMIFLSLPTSLARPTLLIFLSFFLLAPQTQAADPNELLQQGLIEEEANKDLDAAAGHYQSLVDQFDQQRAVAATAIFRLGEIHRKQGNRDQAIEQYQRILREFPRQETLAELSRQNLSALGIDISQSELASPDIAPTAEEAEELRRVQSLAKNSPDLLSPNQRLQEAAQRGFLLVATFLLQHDGDVNATDRLGETPLFPAARSGHKAMVQLLLDHGADVGATNRVEQRTALHIAVIKGHVEVAKTLVANGAEPDAIDNRGDSFWETTGTPLHYAVAFRHPRIVSHLLENEADPNIPNKHRITPLHLGIDYALRASTQEDQAQTLQILRMLIAHGADVNARGPTPDASAEIHIDHPLVGYTALHIVASTRAPYVRKLPVAKLLLENGADVSAFDAEGRTPLVIAKDQLALTRFLLENQNPHIAQQVDSKLFGHIAQEVDSKLLARFEGIAFPIRRYRDYNEAQISMALLQANGIDDVRILPVSAQEPDGPYDLLVRPEERQIAAELSEGMGAAEVGTYNDRAKAARAYLTLKQNGINAGMTRGNSKPGGAPYVIYVHLDDRQKAKTFLEGVHPDSNEVP